MHQVAIASRPEFREILSTQVASWASALHIPERAVDAVPGDPEFELSVWLREVLLIHLG
jgi:hypothetical protein